MDNRRKDIFFALVVLVMLSIISVLMSTGMAEAECDTPVDVPLYGGQVIEVGTVSIWNDETFLYVRYSTAGGWGLSETHLSVADTLDGIPQTKSGNPIPGKFQYKADYDPAVTDYTYAIDSSEWLEGTELFLAAHAVVELDGYETAWGNGLDFPGSNWATYFTYILQSCGEPLPQ